MSTAPSALSNGTSRYSSDFQQVLNRAVAIASLPLAQLQSERTALSDQTTALNSLDTKFSSLESSLEDIESALGSSSWSYSLSDASVVRASVGTGAFEGTYTVEVVDPGSYSNALSADGLAGVSDPATQNISAASVFTLTVGGVEHSIQPQASGLSGLAAAINAHADAGVRATVINIGSSLAPDYRLSLESEKLGAVSLGLSDGTQKLLAAPTGGTLASYRVNGKPAAAVSGDSRTITVAPGLTVTLLKAGTATVTVSRNTAALSTALSSFASAYNAAVDEIDQHRGERAGVLEGNSILSALSQALRGVSGYYAAEGAVSALTAAGLILDDKGKLSFDASALASSGLDSLSAFLGGAQSGGFLKFAADTMNGLEDTDGGILKTTIESFQNQLSSQDERIRQEQERIDSLQLSLQEQMAAADALIASLEQQATYMNSLFQAMQSAQESMR